MLVHTSSFYTPELLRANPDFLFVFGDNLQRRGKGGQAVIRDEPNALGLATKAQPNNEEEAFFFDDAGCAAAIAHDIDKVTRLAQRHMVIIPFTTRVELGTGLSQLPERAPNLYKMLTDTFTADMPHAALKLPHKNPIDMFCDECGSNEIRCDAFAYWDLTEQKWELSSTYDLTVCNVCGAENCAEERPI